MVVQLNSSLSLPSLSLNLSHTHTYVPCTHINQWLIIPCHGFQCLHDLVFASFLSPYLRYYSPSLHYAPPMFSIFSLSKHVKRFLAHSFHAWLTPFHSSCLGPNDILKKSSLNQYFHVHWTFSLSCLPQSGSTLCTCLFLYFLIVCLPTLAYKILKAYSPLNSST